MHGALEVLWQSPEHAVAALVLAHGAGAGMRHASMQAIADAFERRGIATWRFDFPYMAAGRSRVDPPDVADSYPDVPIVGFGGHTDTAGLRRAHTAGFDQVIAKSALDERAKELVKELIAS
jgi:predicted alpha/beta-hydrolase family hydrolase